MRPSEPMQPCVLIGCIKKLDSIEFPGGFCHLLMAINEAHASFYFYQFYQSIIFCCGEADNSSCRTNNFGDVLLTRLNSFSPNPREVGVILYGGESEQRE